MSRDEVYAAVLAFLDQFIARGAAPDILELRAQLASAPAARLLLNEQLPGDDPSEREAFDAMRVFFEVSYEPAGESFSRTPDLVELISWTSWGWTTEAEEQQTADPAQWNDWLASVERTRAPVG
jgi:hypothetical protein